MTPPPKPPSWALLLVSLGVGLGCAVLVAIALTVVDLYLAGHGKSPLSRPWVDIDALGVHVSRADLIFLLAALLGAALTWRAARRGA